MLNMIVYKMVIVFFNNILHRLYDEKRHSVLC